MAGTLLLASCNKSLPDATPIVTTLPTGSTIGDIINTDTTYSIFKIAATRAGVLPTLMDRSLTFTVFLPNNAAFRASGIASDAVMTALPLTTVVPLVQYHITGGQTFGSTAIPTSFPNIQLPTNLVLLSPLFRMSIFPSKRGTSYYANNIPVTSVDGVAANGVINNVAAVVAPPSLVLAQIIYADPNLTYFTAAIARGDSGQVGTNRIDSLLKYPPVNMTVLAPTDAAMRAVLDTNIRRGLLLQNPTLSPAIAAAQATALASSPTVFSNPVLYSVLTATVVRGIVAYHILATQTATTPAPAFTPNIRAFSVNFPTTATFFQTLVNNSLSIHPGISAKATFNGPFVASLQFTGYGTLPTGGAPFSSPAANTVSIDRHAVNGITHTIDRVLLPQ